jgi:hypothetical protein
MDIFSLCFRLRVSCLLVLCLILGLALFAVSPAWAQDSGATAASGLALHTDLLWVIVMMAASGLLGLTVREIAVFKSSAFAQQHAAAEAIADILDDICSAGMAFLTANPTAPPHAAAAWALSEIKASAPGLISQAGSLATDEALGYAVNRKLLTAAQAAPVSDITKAVIATLAPSAATARVTPAQRTAVVAAASAAAPDIEGIAAGLLAKFPGLATLLAQPGATADPVDVGSTPPAPAMPAVPLATSPVTTVPAATSP